jgi:hypothetical protein
LPGAKCKRPSHDNHRNQTIPKPLASLRGARVEPGFLDQEQAIDYAETRANFRSGEIRILDRSGTVERVIAFNEANRML